MRTFDVYYGTKRVAEVRVLDSGEVEVDSPDTDIVSLYLSARDDGLPVMRKLPPKDEPDEIREEVIFKPLSGKTIGLFLEKIMSIDEYLIDERKEV